MFQQSLSFSTFSQSAVTTCALQYTLHSGKQKTNRKQLPILDLNNNILLPYDLSNLSRSINSTLLCSNAASPPTPTEVEANEDEVFSCLTNHLQIKNVSRVPL